MPCHKMHSPIGEGHLSNQAVGDSQRSCQRRTILETQDKEKLTSFTSTVLGSVSNALALVQLLEQELSGITGFNQLASVDHQQEQCRRVFWRRHKSLNRSNNTMDRWWETPKTKNGDLTLTRRMGFGQIRHVNGSKSC